MDAFLARLAKGIRDERLLPSKATILVAVSGGLDSMALLTALVRLRDQFQWRLEVAHFNHHLRGRAADADEKFVQRQCAALKVPCHVGHWLAQDQAAAIKSGGVEQAARQARFDFLGKIARKIGAKQIAFAHHADDQVELFFVRLLRGAGSPGLGGMRKRAQHGAPLRAWLVRPFLDFPRSELVAWATASGIKHREDASNRDARFLRNRVRNELLPYLCRDFSSATRRLVLRTMKGLADEAAWLRAAAVEYLTAPESQRTPFAKCSPALQRHVLALQLERQQLKFDWELIEKLREQPGVTINGPGNQLLSRDEHGALQLHELTELVFQGGAITATLSGSRGSCEVDSLTVKWSLGPCRRPLQLRPDREFFDAAAIGEALTLRHWQPGDRFQPSGMSQPVKLQNLFTNAKVPIADRRQRVIATTASGEVFWVEGLRIGERFKVTSTTRRCLVWRVGRRLRERKPSC